MRQLTSDEYYTTDKLFNLPVVQEYILNNIHDNFVDTNCGIGNWLVKILEKKLEAGIDHETALSQIFGVELFEDTIEQCRERLLCGRDDLRHIVEQNIVCADALTYHYRWDGTEPEMSDFAKHTKDLGIEFV